MLQLRRSYPIVNKFMAETHSGFHSSNDGHTTTILQVATGSFSRTMFHIYTQPKLSDITVSSRN